MFPTLVRRTAEAARPQLAKPIKLKKVWPPDFSKLSAQEQLRFEKRYKRRVMLATRRPLWDKTIKLTQLFAVTFVVVYSVLFMDSGAESNPFDSFRRWFWGKFEGTGLSTAERYERRKDAPDVTVPR